MLAIKWTFVQYPSFGQSSSQDAENPLVLPDRGDRVGACGLAPEQSQDPDPPADARANAPLVDAAAVDRHDWILAGGIDDRIHASTTSEGVCQEKEPKKDRRGKANATGTTDASDRRIQAALGVPGCEPAAFEPATCDLTSRAMPFGDSEASTAYRERPPSVQAPKSRKPDRWLFPGSWLLTPGS